MNTDDKCLNLAFMSGLTPTKLCFRRSERQIILYGIIWVKMSE